MSVIPMCSEFGGLFNNTDISKLTIPTCYRCRENESHNVPGYIQMPGWGHAPLHPKNMNSVVWVKVPEIYTVMSTLLHINLTNAWVQSDLCDVSKVKLVLYERKTKTSGHSTLWHCGTDFPATARLRLSKGADLYVHVVCRGSPHTSFRLYFSVHKRPAPLRVGFADLWNCSVPNFADFKPHFPCDLYPQCVDKEDERDCPYFSEECGLGFVTLGSHCLLYMKSSGTTTWREQGFKCEKRGMKLINFRRQEDYDRLVLYLEPLAAVWGFKRIAVGIHSSSASLPYMYRPEMQHSDSTIAYYRQVDNNQNLKFVCGAIAHKKVFMKVYTNNIKVSYCSRKVNKFSVLCEFPKRPSASDIYERKILLGTVTKSNPPRVLLIGCPQGHVVRDFLACDYGSTCWLRDTTRGVASCLAPLTLLPPMFVCNNGVQRVPYSLVCDLRSDCRDGSDESFCDFPPCRLAHVFQCSNRQCVPRGAVCDGLKDCHNAADEDMCSHKTKESIFHPSPPAIVQLNNKEQFIVRKLSNLSLPACPETHFLCPEGYCMPVFLRCNGVYDCFGWEDEADCNSYTCPGFYRCRGSQVCVHPEHLCDDISQCPQKDDEVLCDLICPENCTCYGSAFYCRHPFQAGNFNKLRFLDGRSSGMRVSDLVKNMMLVHLNLAANGLTSVDELNFPNLQSIDLSDNMLKEIHLHDLSRLPHLKTMSLSGNPLLYLFHSLNVPPEVETMSYDPKRPERCSEKTKANDTAVEEHGVSCHWVSGSKEFNATFYSENISDTVHTKDVGASEERKTFPSVSLLDLSRVAVRRLDSSFLSLLPNLHTVNMSGGGVDTLFGEGFQALTQLRALDLRGCPLSYFPRHMLRGLEQLEIVISDNYKLCCRTMLPSGFLSRNCHSPSGEISSCEALLGSNIYRILLSMLASFTLLGNATAFLYRVFLHEKRMVGFDVFLTHLSVADFLMGVYQTVIVVADRLYQGAYLWVDNTWKNSYTCKISGFLSLVSGEVSALIICLITIERLLVLRFPFSAFNFGVRSAQIASLCMWGLGCLIAALPLAPGVSHWELYGQTAICVPLPLGRSGSVGYSYMFGSIIVANFIFFTVVGAAQIFIYWLVHGSSLLSSDTTKTSQDLIMARRVITVAVSDFLCWFPIGLLGIMAATGTPISGEVNVAVAIFVLPFNSAINPFLYTLNVVLEKRRIADEEQIKKQLMAQFRSLRT